MTIIWYNLGEVRLRALPPKGFLGPMEAEPIG